MPDSPIPTWCFSVVVVRDGDRFLVIQETKHEQRWYFPAGRLEKDETFAEAAVRETLEEAGVEVELDGIIRIERTAKYKNARMRVLFLAHTKPGQSLKSEPDKHSQQARMVTLAELGLLDLRSKEVETIFQSVHDGCQIYPLGILAAENTPFSE